MNFNIVVDSRSFVYSRCRKVLIIMSPHFLEEPECDFQIKFAHALSPGELCLLSYLFYLYLHVFVLVLEEVGSNLLCHPFLNFV